MWHNNQFNNLFSLNYSDIILFKEEILEILQCEPNLDLENIVTPINATKLQRYLVEAKYNKSQTEFLIDGFTN